MKHYFSQKVKTVLAIALILAAGLAIFSNMTGLALPEMFVQGVLTPIRSGASALTAQAEQIYSYLFRYETLQAENEALREKLAELEDDARRADSLAREIDRLKALLELTNTREDFSYVDAYVIGRSTVDWVG